MIEDTSQPAGEKVVFSTRWFEVVEKTCAGCRDPYYLVRSPDCVTVLAMTTAGRILLVSQYRPVLDRRTLELPSGHIEVGDASPEAAAKRELLEETGYQAEMLKLLGVLDPDTGRLKVRLWCYFAPGVRRVCEPQRGEERIDVSECTLEKFLEYAGQGRLRHAQDLAVAFLAVSKGFIQSPSIQPNTTVRHQKPAVQRRASSTKPRRR